MAHTVDRRKKGRFQMDLVLKRLLERGRIVFKRAYCDWSRFQNFAREFHLQGFEMVDIPRSNVSGKNSADIRMVVDAIDLCYSKAHIDTFALLTGDSDFSPLVSKLKENDKRVLGCGVRSSTSDLLAGNCDEFIFYDDLVREKAKKQTRRRGGPAQPAAEKASPPADGDKKQEALDLVMETVEALAKERGSGERIWGSMVKQALKRRRPGFNESYYGFRSFGRLLEEAQSRNLLQLEPDEKSGGVIIKGFNPDY